MVNESNREGSIPASEDGCGNALFVSGTDHASDREQMRDEEVTSSSAVRPSPPLISPLDRVQWFRKQRIALASRSEYPACILVKKGMFNFAMYPTQSELARDLARWVWCAQDENRYLPLFEVIDPASPVKLHLDVEMVCTSRPQDSVVQKMLSTIIALTKDSLPVADQARADEELVSADCRPVADGWKVSFHITWPGVVFADNYSAMKSFIQDRVMPRVREHPELSWGPDKIKWAVDAGIYTRQRAFRIAFASKGWGKSPLIPWDRSRWRPISFGSMAALSQWIYKSLCSRANGALTTFVSGGAATTSFVRQNEGVRFTAKCTAVGSRQSPQKDHLFAACALRCLSNTRAVAHDTWRQVSRHSSSIRVH
jgi:hypothetical protein